MKFKPFTFSLAIIIFPTCIIALSLLPSIEAVQAATYGYINKKGLLVIESQFSEVKNFSQGLAAVKIDNKWGYINKIGLLVIKPQFSDIRSFSQGLAPVKIDNKWGYINRIGKAIIKPQFSEAYSFSEGVAAVTVDGNKWEYIDKSGRRAIRLQFDGIPDLFFEGLAPVTVYEDGHPKNNGYMNRRGQLVIKTQFSEIDRFSEGLAAVETSNGICGVRFDSCAYGYIDKSGKMVIEPNFFRAKEFSQGLAAVATDAGSDGANPDGDFINKWGYINKKGRLVIKPIFSDANNFSEGLAAVEIGRQRQVYIDGNAIPGTAVEIGGKWGYIDGTGKQVISPQFDLANSFSEGLAAVKVKDKCGYVNKIGKVVVQPRFSSCEDFSEGLAAVHYPGQKGYTK